MAAAQLIDLSNYSTLLIQSTVGRLWTPDGNVFFDSSNNKIEFIPLEELATVDLHGGITTWSQNITVEDVGGTFTRASWDFVADGFVAGRSFASSWYVAGGNNWTFVIATVTATVITVTDNTGLVDEAGGGDEVIASVAEANPLAQQEGIKLEAGYAFENQERRLDENLREFDKMIKGSFKFAWAYNFVANNKPSTDADRDIIRGSWWTEFDSAGAIGRIYYGNTGLANIEATSQPYNQSAIGWAPTDFAKLGQFNEAVQVFGDIAVDASTTTFDNRTYEAISIRTFGFNYDRKESTTDLWLAELWAYSSGYAVSETPHLTTGTYTLADVYGGAIIAPFDTMSLEKLASAQVEGWFNEADWNFTWVLHNPWTGSDAVPVAQGTLDDCVAFLDALAQTDDDIDSWAITVTNGKRVNTWYSYNATGQIVTNSWADSLGLFIENIPTADEQGIVQTDDAWDEKTRPFQSQVEGFVWAVAVADTLAWYHAYFLAAYNTASAVTVLDSSASAVKWNVSTDQSANKIIYAFDYDGDTVWGTAGTDKDAVFLCEWDGWATQQKTGYTHSRSSVVSFSCEPQVETNV